MWPLYIEYKTLMQITPRQLGTYMNHADMFHRHLRNAKNMQCHTFIALDLDECSVVGQGTNGILHILDHSLKLSSKGFQKHIQPEKKVLYLEEATKLLLNPSMLKTIENLKGTLGHKPYVVAYSAKAKIAKMANTYLEWAEHKQKHYGTQPNHFMTSEDEALINVCIKQLKKRIQENENGTTIFFEGGLEYDSHRYLSNQLVFFSDLVQRIDNIFGRYCHLDSMWSAHEKCKEITAELTRDLEEVGMCTRIMSKLLNLGYLIPVFIGNLNYKDLETLLPTLGCAFDRIWLFDDMTEFHVQGRNHHKRERKSADELHMIKVPKYNFETMNTKQIRGLENILNVMIGNPNAFAKADKVAEDMLYAASSLDCEGKIEHKLIKGYVDISVDFPELREYKYESMFEIGCGYICSESEMPEKAWSTGRITYASGDNGNPSWKKPFLTTGSFLWGQLPKIEF